MLSIYKDLQIEIERTWQLKATVIPAVVGALGIGKKGVLNHLNSISGEPTNTMLFHKELPRNFMESMLHVMLFVAGICSRSLVLRSYLTSFTLKYSCIKGGFVGLSVFYISVISIQRFWVWIFVSPFFASNSSNVDSWS